MANISNPVAMRHPAIPGEFVVVGARSFPSHRKRGWVEAKSSEAKAAVESIQSPGGDNPPSEGEDEE